MKLEITDAGVFADGERLDGQQIESLIADLAVARGMFNPPVPKRFSELSKTQRLEHTTDPAAAVGLTTDGNLFLSLRHPGFGWCHFDFPLASAARLFALVNRRTGQPATRDIDDADEFGSAH